MSAKILKKSFPAKVNKKKIDQYDLELRNIVTQGVEASKIDATTASSIIESFTKLSKTQEKKLMLQFGIIQSTSTSEREAPQQEATKTFVIREKGKVSLNLKKKVQKPRKLSSLRKPQKKRRFLSAADRKNSRHLKIFRTDTYEADSESTLLSLSENLLDSFTEDEATLEHDSIATKYGLPHEFIKCACYMREKLFGVEKNTKKRQICISRSCYDFQKLYGKNKQDLRQRKDRKTMESLERARETYENLKIKARDIMDEKLFLDSVAFLKSNYPYYWKYVSRKEELYKGDYDRTKEKFSKTRVVLSCMRLLKEQELLSKHYRVEMKGLDTGSKFNDRLNNNFAIASSFLLKEYPSFFAYMMKKYSFNDIVCRKLEIIRNRLRLIKRARLPDSKLKKLNDLHKNDFKRR